MKSIKHPPKSWAYFIFHRMMDGKRATKAFFNGWITLDELEQEFGITFVKLT